MSASRYRLESAVERHEAAPDTFAIPRREVRDALGLGAVVKLIFYPGERMWVRITGRRVLSWALVGDDMATPKVWYTGELLNAPVVAAGVAQGDSVEFGPEHVCAVEVH